MFEPLALTPAQIRRETKKVAAASLALSTMIYRTAADLPDLVRHLTCLYKQPEPCSFTVLMQASVSKPCDADLRSVEPVTSLEKLPLDLLELIAHKLPPRNVLSLGCAIHGLQDLFQSERFWQGHLQHHCPGWVANGIVPIPGRSGGHSWQELSITAAELHADFERGVTEGRQAAHDLWLDWHLCQRKHSLSTHKPYRPCEHINAMLELVFFLWFGSKQLTRGAQLLTQALAALNNLKPEALSKPSCQRYGADWVLLHMAFAASLQLDLLRMRMQPSLLSGSQADTFAWCGGHYLLADLRAASSILLLTSREQQEVPSGDSVDPWNHKTWKLLCSNGARLLHLINAMCQAHAPWVVLHMNRSVNRAHAVPEPSRDDHLVNHRRLYKRHKHYAASCVLGRLSNSVDPEATFHNMWELYSEQLPLRAAYYLGLDG